MCLILQFISIPHPLLLLHRMARIFRRIIEQNCCEWANILTSVKCTRYLTRKAQRQTDSSYRLVGLVFTSFHVNTSPFYHFTISTTSAIYTNKHSDVQMHIFQLSSVYKSSNSVPGTKGLWAKKAEIDRDRVYQIKVMNWKKNIKSKRIAAKTKL